MLGTVITKRPISDSTTGIERNLKTTKIRRPRSAYDKRKELQKMIKHFTQIK